jgi:hypothetical protein
MCAPYAQIYAAVQAMMDYIALVTAGNPPTMKNLPAKIFSSV